MWLRICYHLIVAFRVEEYLREDGSIPFKEWFEQLDHQAAAKVATAVARLSRGEEGEMTTMELTRDFRQTIGERVRRDKKFARSLLDDAATLFLNGEPEPARLLLRDLVNATVGFEALAELTHQPAKSLHRMLSKHGNPSMDNLAVIFDAVRQRLKVELRAQAVKAA